MNEKLRNIGQFLKEQVSLLSGRLRLFGQRIQAWWIEQEKQRPPKFSLRAFFDGQPLAFEDELTNSWEFYFTKLTNVFDKKSVSKNITALSSEVAEIRFLSQAQPVNLQGERYDLESGQWMGLPDTAQPDLVMSVPVIDQAYVNYHSVCCWYQRIRSGLLRNVTVVVLLGVFFIGFWIVNNNLANFQIGNGLEIDYIAPSTGSYKLQVRNLTARESRYFVVFYNPEEAVVIPDFSNTDTLSLDLGQRVSYNNDYKQTKYHLYRIQSGNGSGLRVIPDPRSTSENVEFTLYDHTVNELCGSPLLIGEIHPDIMSPVIFCDAPPGEPYYLKVASSFGGPPSNYSFGVFEKLSFPLTAVGVSRSALQVQPGTYVQDQLVPGQEDWFILDLQAGQKIGAWLSLGDSQAEFSMLLYESSAQGKKVAALSKQLQTSFMDENRTYYLAYILNRFGFSVTWKDTANYLFYIFFIILVVVVLALIGESPFADGLDDLTMKSYLSPRYYQGALAVKALVQVLKMLDNDHALSSDHLKTELHDCIGWAAAEIYQIQRTYQLACRNFATGEFRRQMEDIYFQVLEMRKWVSMPRQDTLMELRTRFAGWLTVLAKSEYGEFQFVLDFQRRQMAWYKRLYLMIAPKWLNYGITFCLALWLVNLTTPIWSPYSRAIASTAGSIIRYIILIIMVDFIYHRWGEKRPAKAEETLWEHTIRVILFFFVPLIIVDILLKTGLTEILMRLLSEIHLFRA